MPFGFEKIAQVEVGFGQCEFGVDESGFFLQRFFIVAQRDGVFAQIALLFSFIISGAGFGRRRLNREIILAEYRLQGGEQDERDERIAIHNLIF